MREKILAHVTHRVILFDAILSNSLKYFRLVGFLPAFYFSGFGLFSPCLRRNVAFCGFALRRVGGKSPQVMSSWHDRNIFATFRNDCRSGRRSLSRKFQKVSSLGTGPEASSPSSLISRMASRVVCLRNAPSAFFLFLRPLQRSCFAKSRRVCKRRGLISVCKPLGAYIFNAFKVLNFCEQVQKS